MNAIRQLHNLAMLINETYLPGQGGPQANWEEQKRGTSEDTTTKKMQTGTLNILIPRRKEC